MPNFQIRLCLPGFQSNIPFRFICDPSSLKELALVVLEEIGGFSKEELKNVSGDRLPLRLLGELRPDRLIDLGTDAQLKQFLQQVGDQPMIEVRSVEPPSLPSSPSAKMKKPPIMSDANTAWYSIVGEDDNEDATVTLGEVTRIAPLPPSIVSKAFGFSAGNCKSPSKKRLYKDQFMRCMRYLELYQELRNGLEHMMNGERRLTKSVFPNLVPRIRSLGFTACRVEDFAVIACGRETLFVEQLACGLVSLRLETEEVAAGNFAFSAPAYSVYAAPSENGPRASLNSRNVSSTAVPSVARLSPEFTPRRTSMPVTSSTLVSNADFHFLSNPPPTLNSDQYNHRVSESPECGQLNRPSRSGGVNHMSPAGATQAQRHHAQQPSSQPHQQHALSAPHNASVMSARHSLPTTGAVEAKKGPMTISPKPTSVDLGGQPHSGPQSRLMSSPLRGSSTSMTPLASGASLNSARSTMDFDAEKHASNIMYHGYVEQNANAAVSANMGSPTAHYYRKHDHQTAHKARSSNSSQLITNESTISLLPSASTQSTHRSSNKSTTATTTSSTAYGHTSSTSSIAAALIPDNPVSVAPAVSDWGSAASATSEAARGLSMNSAHQHKNSQSVEREVLTHIVGEGSSEQTLAKAYALATAHIKRDGRPQSVAGTTIGTSRGTTSPRRHAEPKAVPVGSAIGSSFWPSPRGKLSPNAASGLAKRQSSINLIKASSGDRQEKGRKAGEARPPMLPQGNQAKSRAQPVKTMKQFTTRFSSGDPNPLDPPVCIETNNGNTMSESATPPLKSSHPGQSSVVPPTNMRDSHGTPPHSPRANSVETNKLRQLNDYERQKIKLAVEAREHEERNGLEREGRGANAARREAVQLEGQTIGPLNGTVGEKRELEKSDREQAHMQQAETRVGRVRAEGRDRVSDRVRATSYDDSKQRHEQQQPLPQRTSRSKEASSNSSDTLTSEKVDKRRQAVTRREGRLMEDIVVKKKRAQSATRKQKGQEDEKCFRQMFDKNTLRLMHRDMFVAALAHRTQSAPEIPTRQLDDNDVKVIVRKRPIFFRETEKDFDVVSFTQASCTLTNSLFQADLKVPFFVHSTFQFDNVFGENATNKEVYTETQTAIEYSIQGGSSTIFMLGQTGSGKTHTMTAIEEFAAEDIFTPPGRQQTTVKVNFVEVRSNRVYDLLADDPDVEVKLREVASGQYETGDANTFVCHDAAELISLVRKGHKSRATQCTEANDTSSRSHAAVVIEINNPERPGSTGKLCLVDCAGTERRKDSMHHSKERQTEGAYINASMHALKECIRLRGEKASVPSHAYRASALTKLLAEAFSAKNGKLLVICTISPCATDTEHSLTTLRTGFSLSGRPQNNLVVTKQTGLKELVFGKPKIRHPIARWNYDEVSQWLKKIGQGEHAAVAPGTTGHMLVRFPETRFVQVLGEKRGRRLYDLVRQEVCAK